MNIRLTRAAALVAISIGVPAGAQQPARARDTLVIRMKSPGVRAQLDSINMLFRRLSNEAPMSAEANRLRRELEEVTTALEAEDFLGPARSGTMRVLLAPDMPRELEALRGVEPMRMRGWIGLNTGFAPHTDTMRDGDYLVRYFEHPSIISVEPNSPAEQAGIAPGDVLLAYNGLDLVGRWLDVTRLLEPEKRLAVKVAHDGDTRTYVLTVAHAPEMIRARRAVPQVRVFPSMPSEDSDMPRTAIIRGGFAPSMPGAGFSTLFAARGLFGASLINVSNALSKALRIPMGILVDDVPESTPAWNAGLRPGDVIVRVVGDPATTVNQLARAVSTHMRERAVPLEIVRDHKKKKLTLSW